MNSAEHRNARVWFGRARRFVPTIGDRREQFLAIRGVGETYGIDLQNPMAVAAERLRVRSIRNKAGELVTAVLHGLATEIGESIVLRPDAVAAFLKILEPGQR